MNDKKQNRIQIFCINRGREVLINKDLNLLNSNEVITVIADDIKTALEKIACEWSILCNMDQLTKAFSFDLNERCLIEIYVLQIHLNKTMQNIVLENGHWEFVDYKKLKNIKSIYPLIFLESWIK